MVTVSNSNGAVTPSAAPLPASPFSKKYNPLARSSSQVLGPNFRLTVLTPNLIRYEYSPDSTFEDRASTFAVHRHLPAVPFQRIDRSDGGVEIHTEVLSVEYDGKEFSPSGFTAMLKASADRNTGHVGSAWGKFWRYGMENDAGNLGGTCRTLDNINGRCELEEGVLSTHGFAVVDDSASMLFTTEGWVAPRVPGRQDGYLFAYGDDYRGALQALFSISGKAPAVPRWALGNWWSKYYAYTADEYTGLMDRFEADEIPMSVAVLDMDWHLTDIPPEYGAPWTGYTWDRKLFPDHVGFLKSLHDKNLKTTLNTHPADGVRAFEEQYPAMCKALGRDPSTKLPVTFDCTDRSFLSAYLNTLSHSLEDEGVDFWWIDWQQGPYSKIPGVDPLWMLNHYHFLDSVRHGRPMTFSRYAGPGSHRYPIGFSGDTHVTWESLHFQPEMTATASNIGYGWWSHDIGGHFYGYKDNELLARWTQLGVFSPVLRLHSSNNPFNTREPWRQSAECRSVMTTFLRLRHALVPYIYSCGVRASVEGQTLVEPVYYDHPGSSAAYKYRNTYTFGTELFLAPITSPRDKATLLGKAPAWLPPGKWVDTFTNVVYDGDRALTFHRTLDKVPCLARQGAIIPQDAGKLHNGCPLPTHIEVTLVVGADGAFELLEDNGEGDDIEQIIFARTAITFDQAEGTLTIGPTAHPLVPTREWSVRLPAFRPTPTQGMTAYAGDSPLTPRAEVRANETRIHLGPIPAGEEIVVDLGQNPSLLHNDVKSLVQAVLDPMQVEYNVKLAALQALGTDEEGSAAVALNVAISRIDGMELPSEMRGAVVELLLAESR